MAKVVCACGEQEMEFAKLTQADFGDKGWVQPCCRAKAQADIGRFQAEHYDEAHMAEMHTLQGLDSPEESLENLFTPEQEVAIEETLEKVPANFFQQDVADMTVTAASTATQVAEVTLDATPAPATKAKKRGKKR